MIKVENKEELKKIIIERYEKSEVNKTYTIDVSDLDVSNVKDMKDMFLGCEELKDIKGLENWDVSNVEYMTGMFCCCYNLEYRVSRVKCKSHKLVKYHKGDIWEESLLN